ncbi:Wzz/FepE/Etk N-terminal domain-containing protein [Neobacillus niacini]|uniref:YveK family protein n=1 Tax=Neobacillus niacini TaxID=86668 RepID=UPI0030035B42
MEKEINIKKLFGIIRKRFWVMIVLSVLFASFGSIYSIYFTKPLYESSSRMIVNVDDKLMNTLMVVIKEPSFLNHVVKELDLNSTPEALSQQISAGSIGGSSIVKISVIDTNPELAANIANTTANVFKREMQNTFGANDINIYSKAEIQPNPININHDNKITLSFIIGLIAGAGLIFLLEFLDNTIRTEYFAEQLLEVPVLGSVSKMSKNNISQKRNKRKIEVRRHSFETNE